MVISIAVSVIENEHQDIQQKKHLKPSNKDLKLQVEELNHLIKNGSRCSHF